MTNPSKTARLISIAGTIAGLIVVWQAVRFCQGRIGAPVFDQFTAILKESFGPPPSPDTATGFHWAFAWLYRLYYYLGGIAVWVTLAAIVSSLAEAIARIVEVGFHQYLAECNDAKEESRRFAKIEADRNRRRELRRKRIAAQQPKSSFGFGALLLGILIGKIF